ncbi:MAG: HEAT repeat domain-containing protein [Planctomycetota bacterium]|jgi:HEAT repeat protein
MQAVGNTVRFYNSFLLSSRLGRVGAIHFRARKTMKPVPLGFFVVGEWVRLRAELDFRRRTARLSVNGEPVGRAAIAPRRFKDPNGREVVLNQWGAAQSNWRGGPPGAIHIDEVRISGLVPPGADAFAKLVARLQDKNPAARKKAVRELGKLREARAVEPLVAALRDADRGVRRYAADALGDLKDRRAVEALVATLNDPAGRVRARAAEALGKIGDRRAVPPLIEKLKDEDGSVRSAAAMALAWLRDPGARDALHAATQDPSAPVRGSAAIALAWLGDLTPLLEALQDPAERVRTRAAGALGRLKNRRAVPALVAALRDRAAAVRRGAGHALVRLRWKPATAEQQAVHLVALQEWEEAGALGQAAVEPLFRVLADEETRAGAMKALARLDWRSTATDAQKAAYLVAERRWDDAVEVGPAAVEALAAALDNKFWNVRQDAARALGRLGDQRAVAPLVKLLSDEYKRARRAAAEALDMLRWRPASPAEEAWHLAALERWREAGKLGPDAVPPLLNVLRDADVLAKDEVGHVLCDIGPAVVAPLIAALHDPRSADSAVWVLAQVGDRRAAEPLLAACRDPHSRIRRAAFLTLGEWGDARAVEPLIVALKDDDPNTGHAEAAQALAWLGDPRAVAPLIEALGNPRKREPAARALGELGDRRAVPPLIDALADQRNLGLRIIVVQALGRLSDPRAVEPLLSMATDDKRLAEDAAAVHAAILALGELGDKRAVEPLVSFLDGRHEGRRRSAAAALAKLGDQRALAPLLAELRNALPGEQTVGKPDVVILAVEALRDLGDRRALAPLREAFRLFSRGIVRGALVGAHGSHFMREIQAHRALSGALARLGDAPALDRVIAFLQHEQPKVRAYGAAVLGRIGQPAVKAVPALRAARHDPAREVRRAAVGALKDLGASD